MLFNSSGDIYWLAMSNEYIRGSSIFGGKSCDHCSIEGITCKEAGLFLNDVPIGQIEVEIARLRSFRIWGKLQNCKIAAGKVPQGEGTIQIRAGAERAVKKAIDEIKPEDLDEEVIDFKSNNWS